MPTSAWSKKCPVNINEIYTRLTWVKEEQTPGGPSLALLNHYTDMFADNKNGLPSNRILVQGETGIGKTTFVKKLALDWAELGDEKMTDKQKEILKKFELAVIIDLKKVSKHQSLRDIISASHIFAKEDTAMKDGLLSYITQNQDKVLLVFDGYDEYQHGTNSEIFEIFRGIQLRNCCVLITTRISKADELKEFKDVHAEIIGFSEEDREAFMERILCSENSAMFLTAHLSYLGLEDLARVPLLLLFFCTLWKKGKLTINHDSKTELYKEIVQYVLDHDEGKCSPANFSKVEDFEEILTEIGKVALECLLKDDHVFEYDQLSATTLREQSRVIGLLQVCEYTENLRPAGIVSFIHKSIQEFLAAWFITYRCVPEGNLGEIINRTRTLDDFRSLANVFRFVCGLSDDGAVKVFEHLKSVRISDPELDLSKTIPDGTDEPLCDVTDKHIGFTKLVNSLFGEVQSKTEVFRHYLNCTDGIIFVEGRSVREIVPKGINLNEITLNGVVWYENVTLHHAKLTQMYESIKFLNCLHVPLRMTENSGKIGEFLRKFNDDGCASLSIKCDFTCILHYHNGQAFFYITSLNLNCNDHAGVFYDTRMTSTPSHSTSSSTKEFCLKFLSTLDISVPVNREQTVKCLVTIFRDCKNLKTISLGHVTKSTCELLKYVPNLHTCRVQLGDSLYSLNSDGPSLTSADVMKLAGLLPQIVNLISLGLKLNDCCDEAVTKLVCSITHKTLEELTLHGIKLTPVTAAALGRLLSEMSSLRKLSLSEPIGLDTTSLVLQWFKSSDVSAGGCRFFPSLQSVSLARLNLREQDLCELLENLKLIPNLRELTLPENPLGDWERVHSMVKQALPQVEFSYW